MRVFICWLAIMAACIVPDAGWAQQAEQRSDSLEQEIRLLKLRLDSLEQAMRLMGGGEQESAEPVDELAALRAAARAIAPEQPADTTPRQSVMRSRNLNRLNPEISVTGDMSFNATQPGPIQDNVDLREFSFGFQSPLDPYSNAKVYIDFGGGEFSLEEAYAYWTGLPGGIRLDIGRFRQQVGELNRWHGHALPETEYPLVVTEFMSEDGLIGNGVGAYWLAPFTSPGGATHELWGQVTVADNEALFDQGRRLSFLGHLNNFWQLNQSTYLQLGGNALYGENPDANLETSLFGVDFRVTWRPPEMALFRSFTLRGEGYALRQNVGGTTDTRYGGYGGFEYQASRRLYLGSRFDYVQPRGTAGDDGRYMWAFVPKITFWQTEYVFLRAEWQHLSSPLLGGGRESTNRFMIQVVWSMGPHKHETY